MPLAWSDQNIPNYLPHLITGNTFLTIVAVLGKLVVGMLMSPPLLECLFAHVLTRSDAMDGLLSCRLKHGTI